MTSLQSQANSIPEEPADKNHHLSMGPLGVGIFGSKWLGKGPTGPSERMAAMVSSNRATFGRLIN